MQVFRIKACSDAVDELRSVASKAIFLHKVCMFIRNFMYIEDA